MFKPNEIERFSMMLDPQMKKLEERIMEDIVRRIKINGEITRAADWQINRLQQLGVSMKTVENEIQRALNLDDADMEKLYSDITERGYARDNKLYEATGKQQIPFEENAELQQLISSVANQTNETMRNITQSLGFAVRQPDGKLGWSPLAQYYQQTLDGAMLDIASGAFDYNTVLKRVVNEMTNSGLRTIDYATGHKNRVDVAARRALMTGMSQITAKVNADNMEALDTEYVEVTWHGGARPSHQVWQGKIYHWRRGGNTGTAVPTAPRPQAQKVQYSAGKALTSEMEMSKRRNQPTSINRELIFSPEYVEKFNGISGNKETDELICKKARDMLTHRNNTLYEDMYLFDEKTKMVVGTQTHSNKIQEVVYNESLERAVKKYKEYSLISLHNHPESKPPSGSDFASCGGRKYKKGIICCHNGDVYIYQSGKKPFTAKLFDITVDKYKKRGYNEYDAYEETLKQFQRDYGIRWEKR